VSVDSSADSEWKQIVNTGTPLSLSQRSPSGNSTANGVPARRAMESTHACAERRAPACSQLSVFAMTPFDAIAAGRH